MNVITRGYPYFSDFHVKSKTTIYGVSFMETPMCSEMFTEMWRWTAAKDEESTHVDKQSIWRYHDKKGVKWDASTRQIMEFQWSESFVGFLDFLWQLIWMWRILLNEWCMNGARIIVAESLLLHCWNYSSKTPTNLSYPHQRWHFLGGFWFHSRQDLPSRTSQKTTGCIVPKRSMN